MAILTKNQLLQFNRKMLGVGAPIHIDGLGYNYWDQENMMPFADFDPECNQLSNRQALFIAKTLDRYRNTQLRYYRKDLSDTITCYEQAAEEQTQQEKIVEVLGVHYDYVTIRWHFNESISKALRGKLDKSQYIWKKYQDQWLLQVNWEYIPIISQAFQKRGLDTTQLDEVYNSRPIEQLSLFPEL